MTVYRNCRSRGMSAEEAAAIADISALLAQEAEQQWQQEKMGEQKAVRNKASSAFEKRKCTN